MDRSFLASKKAVKLKEQKQEWSFQQMRSEIIGDTSEEELSGLWSIGYKHHLLPIISPANQHALVWSKEEDTLILDYYFHQTDPNHQMASLLTRKSLDYVIERYRFMNLSVSDSLQKKLAALKL